MHHINLSACLSIFSVFFLSIDASLLCCSFCHQCVWLSSLCSASPASHGLGNIPDEPHIPASHPSLRRQSFDLFIYSFSISRCAFGTLRSFSLIYSCVFRFLLLVGFQTCFWCTLHSFSFFYIAVFKVFSCFPSSGAFNRYIYASIGSFCTLFFL